MRLILRHTIRETLDAKESPFLPKLSILPIRAKFQEALSILNYTLNIITRWRTLHDQPFDNETL
jgi:hypothetical protein